MNMSFQLALTKTRVNACILPTPIPNAQTKVTPKPGTASHLHQNLLTLSTTLSCSSLGPSAHRSGDHRPDRNHGKLFLPRSLIAISPPHLAKHHLLFTAWFCASNLDRTHVSLRDCR